MEPERTGRWRWFFPGLAAVLLGLATMLFIPGGGVALAGNGAPVISPNPVPAMTAEDTPVDITIPATDPDGDDLVYFYVTSPAHGALSGPATRTRTYTPAADYFGPDSYKVQVYDGQLLGLVTVNITVTPVNDPPVATDDTFANSREGVVRTFLPADLTANDSVGPANEAAIDSLSITAVSQPVGGTIQLSGGAITFTPSSGFSGAASFRYTVSDSGSLTDLGTARFTVTPLDAGPTAPVVFPNPIAVTTAEDTATTITVAATDANDDTLTYTVASNPAHGVLTGSGATRTYTPALNYNGPDTYTVTVSDGALTATATVDITVTPVNDAPTAVNDTFTFNEDALSNISATMILANDTDVEGGVLTVANLRLAAAPNNIVFLLSGGSIGYQSNTTANVFGQARFTYQARDSAGALSATVTITINITSVNDAPTATNDALASSAEDTIRTIPFSALTSNDSPGPLESSVDSVTVSAVSQPAGGTVAIVGGNVVFTPTANFSGAASFRYTIRDTGNLTATATASFTITAVDDAPVASPQSVSTAEDTARAITLSATDPDNSGLTFAYTQPTSGTVTGSGASVTYTPALDFNDPDSFTFTASDGISTSIPATVTVTVTAVNDPPTAADDTLVSGAEDTVRTIAAAELTGNDTGGPSNESQTLAISAVDQVAGGTAMISGGAVVFTPAPNGNGPASFRYTVSDGGGLTATATASFTITAVNDAPTATNDALAASAEDVVRTIPGTELTGNDSAGPEDESDQTLAVTAVSAPSGGTVAIVGTDIVFTPTANASGPVSFTYTVTDSGDPALSATAMVSFTVTAVNDAPVIDDDSVPAPITAEADGPTGAIVAFDPPTATDVDPDDTATVVCLPASGARFPLGQTTVTCTATDGDGATDTATFTVTVVDTTPPTLTVPAPITAEATGPNGASVTFTPSATDAVDLGVEIACIPVSGHVFPLGPTTVTCTATDDARNTTTGSFTVTIVDTTAPIIDPASVPGTPTVVGGRTVNVLLASATGATTPVTWMAVTASDLVDGNVTAACLPASGASFAVGDTEVTCTPTDAAGNPGDPVVFRVRVRDLTPPVFSGVTPTRTVEATSSAGAVVPYPLPTATDAVDGSRPVACAPPPGATFPIGTTTVTCTARDVAGNEATVTFIIRVVDTTGPTIVFVGGPQPNQTYTQATLPAAPTCVGTDAAGTVTQCVVYGYSTAVGPHTLTARARDTDGNSTVSTRTYTVTAAAATSTPRPTGTPRPTATPTRQPTATPPRPTQPTATPTRPPRTPVSQPTVTPVPPTIAPTTAPTQPPVPTTTPTRPPRR